MGARRGPSAGREGHVSEGGAAPCVVHPIHRPAAEPFPYQSLDTDHISPPLPLSFPIRKLHFPPVFGVAQQTRHLPQFV